MRTVVIALAASAAYLCSAGQSHALPSNPSNGRAVLPQPVRNLVDTAAVTPPFAYLRFCHLNPTECGSAEASGNALIRLTEENWSLIQTINTHINLRIAPDSTKGGYDWSTTATVGNCNDYAVQKRKTLIELGFPASALSLAVVVTSEGIGHLVLTVRSDRGDFVLDNLHPSVMAWTRVNYRWVKRQSAGDLNEWTAVDPGATRSNFLELQADASSHRRAQQARRVLDRQKRASGEEGGDQRMRGTPASFEKSGKPARSHWFVFSSDFMAASILNGTEAPSRWDQESGDARMSLIAQSAGRWLDENPGRKDVFLLAERGDAPQEH